MASSGPHGERCWREKRFSPPLLRIQPSPMRRVATSTEIDPQTGTAVVREAFGSRPHEGMRFDKDGNLMASRRPARATSTSLCRLSAMT